MPAQRHESVGPPVGLRQGRVRDSSWTPIEVLGKRYKSSSPDSEDFIHDPLSIMIRDGTTRNDDTARRALKLIIADWHVSTLVVEPSGDAVDPPRATCS